MIKEIVLRPATTDDDALLYALFCEVRGPMFHSLPARQRDILLGMQFHAQASAYEHNYPTAQRMVVVVNGQSAGAVLLERTTEVWRLVDISLLASYRNQGIGTRLMRDLLGHAAASGHVVRLCVARDNPARRIYGRSGMHVVAEDDVYLTMESELPAKKYASDFVPHINTNFMLHDGSFFVLEQVNEAAPSDQFERFTLLFRRDGPLMPQGTYNLAHPLLEEIKIFLVPVAPCTYEALFSHERRREN
jgi:ribosomal protein S18 acetylase RimI-like enzyme